jgi:hypothetical protein
MRKVCVKNEEFNWNYHEVFGEEKAIADGYKIIEIPDGYENCVFEDFDDNGFNVELYNNRKQGNINEIKILQLDNWFKNNYTMYEQMFTRRKVLGIEDVIEDEFRNRVGENAYHNLIELYEEAEVVAGEIRVLKEKLKTEV